MHQCGEAALPEIARILIQFPTPSPFSATPQRAKLPHPQEVPLLWHLPPLTSRYTALPPMWAAPSRGRAGEARNLSQDSCRQSSHQGFHSGGNGATMPSLASHISSGSFSGSIPISRAKSWISRKTEEESMEMVYTRHYAIKPASSAKAMGTLGNPDPQTKLLKAVSTALRVSEHILTGW